LASREQVTSPLQIRPIEQSDWPGVASRLGEHSLQTARRLGCPARLFNLVVSTNTAGLRCWQTCCFHRVGTLPGAFRHRQFGDVDALVMFRALKVGPGA
jgi:hypothetical protein